MTSREQLKQNFLSSCGLSQAACIPASEDASFRRYYRITDKNSSFILMDAPPDKENTAPFIAIAEFLGTHGFSAPHIYERDITNGFLLLEDFGEGKFSTLLAHDTSKEKELYTKAVDVLHRLHQLPPPARIPLYDSNLLIKECLLFTEWYLPLVLEKSADSHTTHAYTTLWNTLLTKLNTLPRVLVLRDYHADNLMWLPSREKYKTVGLLDFQDAVSGSPAYDMVSLLEDARRDVSSAIANAMITHYLAGMAATDKDTFMHEYHILGAQRNLKILGIFSRLAVRDGKPSYLRLLPRVWGYLEQDISYPALRDLKTFLDELVPYPLRNSVPEYSKDVSKLHAG